MLNDADLSILGLAAEPMLKMLAGLEQRHLNTIYGNFKSGKTDFIADIAKWVCLREQMKEIESVLRQHHKQEEKKHASTTNDRDTERFNTGS